MVAPENVMENIYFITFSHFLISPSTYVIKNENFRQNFLILLTMVVARGHQPPTTVVGHQRLGSLVQSGGWVTNSGSDDSVDKFWMKQKIV